MINNFNMAKRRRLGIVTVLMSLALLWVIYNLYSIQIVKFDEFQQRAIDQQTSETSITAKRGTIYDRNMKPLAESVTAERVFVAPVEIATVEEAKLIAEKLSEILDVEYDFVYEKTQKKNRKDESIKNNVEMAAASKVREFIDEYKVKGVHLAQTPKRYYRNSNLASHVIGFIGADNNGRLGIELKYDEQLKGINGRVVSAKNGIGKSMPFEYEKYIDAKDGNSLILTIDWNIQNYLEKNLETAYAESQPNERVTGIVMDPNTGEILAMATKPDFDLNNPYDLDESFQKILDETEFESEEAMQKQKTDFLYMMWKNKSITEPYEPGSTFKVITASMALEEKAVAVNDIFTCTGVHVVAGESIKCHQVRGHGTVSFAVGLQQSCNPTIMRAAEKVGGETFLKYFDAFGFNERTGIDLPGEAKSITHIPKNFRAVELATSSFGQTFKVTPIQQIAGLSVIANGGKLVVPHVVKSIIDSDGNIIKSYDTEIKRTILSEENCEVLAEILADGVKNGGAAKNAFVKGYNIAAKTGTSQKRDNEDETTRIGSCMAFAPAENPQIIVIIVVDEPTVGSIYGGVNSAPYVAKTIEETLMYLGIEPKYTNEEIAQMEVIVKDYRGDEVSAALKDITSKELTYTVEGNGIFVTDQIPKAGSSLRKGGNVILYTESENVQEKEMAAVPNVKGLTAESANQKIVNLGLNIMIIGAEDMNSSAIAVTQSPDEGEIVPKGTIVTVEFRHYDGVH